MKYTLRQLHIFLAVCQHQSISKAANTLHMSQSAASEALLTLEHNYGLDLFTRTGKKLALNAVGKTIRIEAENLLTQCQQFEELMLGHRHFGHLKLGASFTIGNHLATRYLADYLGEFPHADVQLDIANTPEVVAKVLNYEIDIGMIESEVQHPDLELIPWREDQLIVFCSVDHPLASKGKLSNKDIREAQWILREPESGARHTFERVLADLLPSINIFLEFKHNEAIKNAVESGLGIGCLSEIVLRKNLKNGDLVPLKLPARNMHRRFYFALPKRRSRVAAVDAWMNACRQAENAGSV